jgi:hypothetical protein
MKSGDTAWDSSTEKLLSAGGAMTGANIDIGLESSRKQKVESRLIRSLAAPGR